jgi:hypothetical protein
VDFCAARVGGDLGAGADVPFCSCGGTTVEGDAGTGRDCGGKAFCFGGDDAAGALDCCFEGGDVDVIGTIAGGSADGAARG